MTTGRINQVPTVIIVCVYVCFDRARARAPTWRTKVHTKQSRAHTHGQVVVFAVTTTYNHQPTICLSLIHRENRRETREHEIVLVLVARTLHMRARARACV